MMKIVSKILMFVLLVLSFSLPIADKSYALAQISLQNNSNFWLNLYIDGNFGCGPVMPSGFCTSSVKAGPHLLEAKKGEEVISSEKDVNIGDGTSPTWTVNYEEPATVEGVWQVISVSPLNSFTQGALNNKVSIVRKGEVYEVKWLDGPLTGAPAVYSGSEKQIVKVYNDPILPSPGINPGDDWGDSRPANLAQEVAGMTYPDTVSYTLSVDGNSLQKSWDAVSVQWKNGHYSHYVISPGFFKETLKRISGPVSKPIQ